MEILEVFKGYSLEVILISICAFLLTYLIKLPIKKATEKLDEPKRKMVNVVILFIPLVLSLIFSFVYYMAIKRIFDFLTILSCGISAYLLSLSLYAIVNRFYLVIVGLLSGKTSYNKELSSDTIKYIKDNISKLLKNLKIDEKSLNDVLSSLKNLNKQKELLIGDSVCADLKAIQEVNSQISELEKQKQDLESEITSSKDKIARYKEELYKN